MYYGQYIHPHLLPTMYYGQYIHPHLLPTMYDWQYIHPHLLPTMYDGQYIHLHLLPTITLNNKYMTATFHLFTPTELYISIVFKSIESVSIMQQI